MKKKWNGDILIVYLYVDDLIFVSNNSSLFDEFKKEMAIEFEMTVIWLMAYYLVIEVKQTSEGTFVSQMKILKDFNCHSVSTLVC